MIPNKKISIVVPNYKNSKYLERTLKSLIEQTHKNIEIIVVCDKPEEDCDKLVKSYMEKDKRIVYIKNDERQGKFKARIQGAQKATGDYIAFLDADNYASIDFYRNALNNAQANNSDIVIGNIVYEQENGEKNIYNLMQLPLKTIEGKDCFIRFFEQNGLNPFWNKIWNKIYSKQIFDKALTSLKKFEGNVNYTSEFILSTMLFFYANKVTKFENDNVFYIDHKKNRAKDEILQDADEVIKVFKLLEDFLKEEKIYSEMEEYIEEWKHFMYQKLIDDAENAGIKKQVESNLENFGKNHKELLDKNYFKCVKSVWNDNLEQIKRRIANEEIKYVSFDIFDTLVVRPFLNPTDLFSVVDKEFRKFTKNSTGMDFTKIRIFSEIQTRVKKEKEDKKCQDITLDEIYQTIEEEYHIDKEILEKTKQKEIEYEIRFCTKRFTGFELYEMALALGKKVICVSDMYLPKDVIEKILNKNEYTELSNVYVSSELKITKAHTDLFKYVLEKEGIEAKEMAHIGDNYVSDYENPKKIGIQACHLPKASDVFQDRNVTHNLSAMLTKSLPMWRDNRNSLNFLGIRCMMGIVANKYFDNPYKSFNYTADFNADPYLIGYYALGMYMLGLTKWMLDDMQGKDYKKIVFMARDGYLPIKCYEIMKKLYKNVPESDYLYISRKALIPITIQTKLDLYKLSEVINVTNHSPNDILKYIKDCITVKDKKQFDEICKQHKIKMDEDFKIIENFDRFISLVIDNLYDEEKQNKNLAKYKEYFEKMYEENSATFDIGYSARPEMFLSNLLEKPIDTYFCNINHSEALRHAQIGGFKLKTFFDAKPTSTGHAYEMLLSALAPSCIGYDVSGEEVKPIFEKYENTYTVEFAIRTMQSAAEDFVRDMVGIFGEDIDIIYYQNYYISLPFMAYLNSSKKIDKMPLSSVIFEDNVGLGDPIPMVKNWTQDVSIRNQATLDKLLNIDNDVTEFLGDNELVYNSTVDLKNRSKFVRLIYYFVFDRKTLSRRIGEVCYKNKILRKIYNAVKK